MGSAPTEPARAQRITSAAAKAPPTTAALAQSSGAWLLRAWLATLCLLGLASGAHGQAAPTCSHTYMDGAGRTECADSWEDVPDMFRSTARPATPGVWPQSQPSGPFWPWDQEPEPELEQGRLDTIYKYQDRSGRECFTNVWDQVPTTSRSRAKAVDLSRAILNIEEGKPAEQTGSQQHEGPSDPERCQQARSRAEQGWFSSLWPENRILIGIAGLLLLFLVATPLALRKLHAPDWSRTLTMAIQTLGLIGLIMYGMVRANTAYQGLRQGLKACKGSTGTEATTRSHPIRGHVELFRDLQKKLDRERSATLKRGIDSE